MGERKHPTGQKHVLTGLERAGVTAQPILSAGAALLLRSPLRTEGPLQLKSNGLPVRLRQPQSEDPHPTHCM